MTAMKAYIYQPPKNAMQSGRANSETWVLELERLAPMTHDPLMGWVSSADTSRQLRLRFDSQDAAEAFAKKKGYEAVIALPRERRVKPKAYADNFKWRQPDT